MCRELDRAGFSEFHNLPSGHFLLVLLLESDPYCTEDSPDAEVLEAFLETIASYERYCFFTLFSVCHAWRSLGFTSALCCITCDGLLYIDASQFTVQT